jgi:hypothetical protein
VLAARPADKISVKEGDDSCGFNNALSLVKIGVRVGLELVLRAMSLELLLVVFNFVRVFSVKLKIYCAFY